MKFYVILPLFFLLLIAGCTQQTGTSIITVTSKGLNILNFTSNFNTLRVHESSNVKLEFKNNGDFEARNVTTILYGEGLLERLSQKEFSERILPGKEDVQFWVLNVPLELSKTESTTYTLGARVYYYYNFSGFQQAGFVPSSYIGEDLPLASGTGKGLLTVSMNVRNPIRTLPEGDTIFTITAVITDTEEGNVDYINCSALSSPPCRKGGHLNELRLTVPSKWVPVTSMNAWRNETKTETNETTYVLNYDSLENEYNKKVSLAEGAWKECSPSLTEGCNSDISCCSCAIRTGGTEGNARCNSITDAISNLRLVRGDEARIVLQFSTQPVTDTIIETVKITGDYSYETDTHEFKKSLTLNIKGD